MNQIAVATPTNISHNTRNHICTNIQTHIDCRTTRYSTHLVQRPIVVYDHFVSACIFFFFCSFIFQVLNSLWYSFISINAESNNNNRKIMSDSVKLLLHVLCAYCCDDSLTILLLTVGPTHKLSHLHFDRFKSNKKSY